MSEDGKPDAYIVLGKLWDIAKDVPSIKLRPELVMLVRATLAGAEQIVSEDKSAGAHMSQDKPVLSGEQIEHIAAWLENREAILREIEKRIHRYRAMLVTAPQVNEPPQVSQPKPDQDGISPISGPASGSPDGRKP